MAWVKLDDNFVEHPKVLAVGPLAGWLHLCAISYCNRNLTDGEVPKAIARRLADIPSPQRHIDALVDAGMLLDKGDHFVVHDYLEYQPSRADALAIKAKESHSGAYGNHKRWHVKKGIANPECEFCQGDQ